MLRWTLRSALAGVAGLAAAAIGIAAAQESKPLPTFEVASVKMNTSGPGGPMMLAPRGERFVATNVPVATLVTMAYQLRPHQLIEPPRWMLMERFDIQAKAPSGTPLVNPQATQQPFLGTAGTPQPFMLMLRGLLTERFGLTAHTETREQPVYTLVRARPDGRLGPKIKPSTIDCAAVMRRVRESGAPPAMPSGPPKPTDPPSCFMFGGMGRLSNASMPIAVLALMLEGQAGRSVLDRTGLEGSFEVDLTWTPDFIANRPAGAPPPPPGFNGQTVDLNGPTLFTALQEQLGLKLESGKAEIEVFVIDSVSRPTPD